MESPTELFASAPDFCKRCGTVLPLPGHEDYVECKMCGARIDVRNFHGLETFSRVVFNDRKAALKKAAPASTAKPAGTAGGPQVFAMRPRRDDVRHAADEIGRRRADHILLVPRVPLPGDRELVGVCPDESSHVKCSVKEPALVLIV
ncbi:hypothetical protein MTO96_011099 [Rhipicephalus appendiculatus]